MISLLRVDGRLVHGMVAVTWVGELKPNVLVVANDAAANDSFHTMTLKLAKPANVDMYVWTLGIGSTAPSTKPRKSSSPSGRLPMPKHLSANVRKSAALMSARKWTALKAGSLKAKSKSATVSLLPQRNLSV